MALVQVAHRGNETDAVAARARRIGPSHHLARMPNHLNAHNRFPLRPYECSGPGKLCSLTSRRYASVAADASFHKLA